MSRKSSFSPDFRRASDLTAGLRESPTIKKGTGTSDDNVVFSWPKGEYKANDELTVDIVCQIPGNAPTPVKATDKLA